MRDKLRPGYTFGLPNRPNPESPAGLRVDVDSLALGLSALDALATVRGRRIDFIARVQANHARQLAELSERKPDVLPALIIGAALLVNALIIGGVIFGTWWVDHYGWPVSSSASMW